MGVCSCDLSAVRLVLEGVIFISNMNIIEWLSLQSYRSTVVLHSLFCQSLPPSRRMWKYGGGDRLARSRQGNGVDNDFVLKMFGSRCGRDMQIQLVMNNSLADDSSKF